MDMDDLKKKIQSFFGDGLVTIIGTGLSIAEGIPGMRELQDYLQQEISKEKKLIKQWTPINDLLTTGTGLEAALLKSPPNSDLESTIVDLTAQYILPYEKKVIEEVIEKGRLLRFARLLKYMLKPNNGIAVITTNYDRLIEIASECAGLAVDTMFWGHHLCKFSPKESRFSLCRGINRLKGTKNVKLDYKEFVKIYKPHGSLDWYQMANNPIRSHFDMDLPRLIITPGLNKYFNGYDRPFDKHREKANDEIDRASRYLIIGYGFNDMHLETHLQAQIMAGKPALIITYQLTEKARELVKRCKNIITITADDSGNDTVITMDGEEKIVKLKKLWDINVFINEVFEPW